MVKPFIVAAAMAVPLAGLLIGCESVIVERFPGSRGGDAVVDLDQATRGGAILTTIIGNPFGVDKKAFDARVLRLMKGQNRGGPAVFVAAPDHRTDPSYNVVVVFNPPSDITSDALCRKGDGLSSRPYAKTLTMAIAFCLGDKAKAGATGRVAEIRGIDDPNFTDLVSVVTRAMIPAKSPSLPLYPHYDGQYTHDDKNEGDDDHDNEPASEPADRDD